MSPEGVAVLHVDLEEWLCRWVKARGEQIAPQITWVSNRERPDEVGGPPTLHELHVIVRDDSGAWGDVGLRESSVGVSVLAAEGRSRRALSAALRFVALFEAQAPLGDGPVAGVDVVSVAVAPDPTGQTRVYARMDVTVMGAQLA